MAHAPPAPKGEQGQPWNSGLFDCFADCQSCLIGYFAPCALYGYNHEKITNQAGCCMPCLAFFALQFLAGCVCCLSGPDRTTLRAKYGLKEGPCSDWCIHFWCVPCALCQEAREVDYRLTIPATAPGGAGYNYPAAGAPGYNPGPPQGYNAAPQQGYKSPPVQQM